MDTKHLTYFKVENFKRFDSLEVKDIGQFNLIVGDNNVGKTSLLEALLFDDESYNQFLKNMSNALLYNRRIAITEDVVNYLDFYLKIKKNPIIFTYKHNDNNAEYKLVLKKAILNDLTEEELKQIDPWTIKNNNTRHLIKFEFNGKSEFYLASIKFLLDETEDNSSVGNYPFIGFNSQYEYDVFNFSKISISTAQLENLQSELKYLIPNLISIEINNAVIPNKSIITIREANADILRPLSQYGDGAMKLFKYLLELDLCENHRLMIDEIDAGIHYSKLKEFLKKVLQSAKYKNVQIFATTHSKECLQYYTEALQELGYENDGRIIKIADTKIGIKTYTYNFEQFENSLYAYSEIR